MRMILCRIGLVLWLSALFNLIVSGQELTPRFKSYSNNEGLSQNVTLSIFQDSKNFMWFGTQDGLNKFDGLTFKIYRNDPEDSASISDNWVGHIFMEDRDGDLWMANGDGIINVYSPKYESFQKILTSTTDKKVLLPFRWMGFVKQDQKGFVWISTDRGLFRWDKITWKADQVFVNPDPDKPRFFRTFFEDANHHIWFGSTQDVLVWDAEKNKVVKEYFFQDPKSKNAIKSVYSISDDSKNIIWMASDKEIIGYNLASKKTEIISFEHLLALQPSKKQVANRKGQFAFVDKDNQNGIWICTIRGLVYFNPQNKTLKSYLSSQNPNSLSSNEISSFYCDKQGDIWIGTTNGLNKFDKKTDSFIRASIKPGSEITSGILQIFEDKNGNIWTTDLLFQAEGNHLSYLNKKTMQLVQVRYNPSDPNGITTDLVFGAFTDKQQNLWLGTFGSGVIRYAPFQKKFGLLAHQPGNINSLAGNSSWAMTEDNSGKLWLAMYLEGLDCYDPLTNTVVHYKEKINTFLKAKNVIVISVNCDKSNTLWIGTMGFGVISMNMKTGKMKHYFADHALSNTLSSNFILAMNIDRKGNILIAHSGTGLDILDPNTGKIVHYKSSPGNENSLVSNTVRAVIESSDGNYWISTDGAITRFNPSTNKMIHYLSKKTGGKGIIANKASCILEDYKGNIWVGTHGGGLSLFDPRKDEFRYWTDKNGLINNVVYGILEDESHKLWLSTNNGISCFDPMSEKFTNYYANDGLQGSEFNANAYARTRNGKMYFGGIEGITTFFPEEINPDPVAPQISITSFQVFNQKVEVLPYNKRYLYVDSTSHKLIEEGDRLFLPINISYTHELALDYRYKVFTFEFAALRFDMPERCTFMYKMEGFEDDWNNAGTRRFATYTNLPPGEYVFKVTAANADGIWNPEPAKIKVIIIPPFYLTWWFISLATMMLIVFSVSFIRSREHKLKRDKTLLERKVKDRTQELNNKNEELVLRNIQILKQKEEIAFQAKQLRVDLDTQNKTSELALLRTQVNPHFLFNTLNNIYSLVYQRSTEAPEAVMRLSDIMRYMLYDATTDRVLLEKEITYLKSFIELQQLRLKHKDFVKFEITGDPSGKLIAPMLLIPFIENAFKHGNKSVAIPGIIIKLNCASGLLTFEIFNRKTNIGVKDSSGGIGLQNVKRRLELIYPEKYKLEIVDNDEKFDVKLEVSE